MSKTHKFLSLLVICALVLVMALPALATNESTPVDIPSAEPVDDSRTLASKTQAIIIVPGIGGTVLSYKDPTGSVPTVSWYVLGNVWMSSCNENGVSDRTILPDTSVIGSTYGIFNTYKPLYDRLNKDFGQTHDIIFFPYDWRMSCTSAASQLQSLINGKGYTKVSLVAHSMGGLVANYYAGMSTANRNKIDKLITIGTPYLGSPKAVHVMETGGLMSGVTGLLTSSEIKTVIKNIPAAYQLLPPNRDFTNYLAVGGTIKSGYANTAAYLKTLSWCKKTSGVAKPMLANAESFHTTLVNNGMMKDGFSGVATFKILGLGQNTITRVNYNTNGSYGTPTKTNAGDGTVTEKSAKNNTSYSTRVYTVTAEHLALVKNSTVLTTVCNIISGATIRSEASEYTMNEKGWIVGEGFDTQRISVKVAGGECLSIHTAAGEEIVEVGDSLFVKSASGDSVKVGNMYAMGSEESDGIEYYLNDGEYVFQIESDSLRSGNDAGNSDIAVEYSDAGYYNSVIIYEDVSAPIIQLNVGDSIAPESTSMQDVSQTVYNTDAVDRPAIIAPTAVLGAEQLVDY